MKNLIKAVSVVAIVFGAGYTVAEPHSFHKISTDDRVVKSESASRIVYPVGQGKYQTHRVVNKVDSSFETASTNKSRDILRRVGKI